MFDRKLPFEFVNETLKRISFMLLSLSESLDIENSARRLSYNIIFAISKSGEEMTDFTAYYLKQSATCCTLRRFVWIVLSCHKASMARC